MNTKLNYKTLEDLYDSKRFEHFISDKLGNDLFISDPDRANRIHKYAENGCNGSTHSEVINDWRDYLNTLSVFDPEYDDIEDIDNYDITQEIFNSIKKEIDDCEQWHENNNSLYQIIN